MSKLYYFAGMQELYR